jgi:predicted NUDIX family NTP pyrophosphohydrolase
MYRLRNGALEALLAHPGGPLYARKDEGFWTIPKGEYDDGEDALTAARREFREETSVEAPADAEYRDLGEITQKGGKVVRAWAFAGDADTSKMVSNTFEMEWPPRSGKVCRFPEVDRCAFFTIKQAINKIKQAQAPLLERLRRAIEGA